MEREGVSERVSECCWCCVWAKLASYYHRVHHQVHTASKPGRQAASQAIYLQTYYPNPFLLLLVWKTRRHTHPTNQPFCRVVVIFPPTRFLMVETRCEIFEFLPTRFLMVETRWWDFSIFTNKILELRNSLWSHFHPPLVPSNSWVHYYRDWLIELNSLKVEIEKCILWFSQTLLDVVMDCWEG